METNLVWETILAELRLSLSGANFQTWFKGKTEILSITDSSVEIGCQSAFIRDWIEQRYYQQIKMSLDRLLEKNVTLTFSVTSISDRVPVKTKTITQKEAPLFEITLDKNTTERINQAGLNPNYTFENFIVGESNQLAHAVATAISQKPGSEYNPYFLYGGVGVGKTHLMQAIGNSILVSSPRLKIVYCTSERFTNELIEAIQMRKTASFRNRYRNVDLLLIDDIQFIAGRESTQEEFFHTFNALHSAGKQVIMTSDRPPAEIKKLEERLRSRFEGGMIADIQNPGIDLREAILLSKCRLQGQQIPAEIVRYLASAITGSVRDLEGCLVRLITRARMSGESYSLELAKKIIGTRLVEKRPNSAKKVLELVADFFDIKVSDLKGASRQARFAMPRQLSYYLLRKELGLPYEKIAEILVKKDHTTILHGVDKIEKAVDNSPQINAWLMQLTSLLAQGG